MSHKMSKREGGGGLLLWDIIREKFGSKANLPPGGGGIHTLGWDFRGGGSDPGEFLLYNTSIEYILLP